MTSGSKPEFAGAVVGLVILLDAGIARWMLEADEARVYVLGRPVDWVCGFRSRFGVPCPTCGLTRSIALTLRGEVGRAWHLAPVGPVAVAGALLVAIVLLIAAGSAMFGSSSSQRISTQTIRRWILVYGAVCAVVLMGGWMAAVSAAGPFRQFLR